MSKSLSTIQKERIEQHLINEIFVETIHHVENVFERVIQKIKTNIHIYKTHTASQTIKQNHSITLINIMRYELKHFVKSKF